MGLPPCAVSHVLTRLNGREPKKPRAAESGDDEDSNVEVSQRAGWHLLLTSPPGS